MSCRRHGEGCLSRLQALHQDHFCICSRPTFILGWRIMKSSCTAPQDDSPARAGGAMELPDADVDFFRSSKKSFFESSGCEDSDADPDKPPGDRRLLPGDRYCGAEEERLLCG
jgi:hypothetical protein